MAQQSNLKAALWMACALGCFLLMTWSGRESTKDLPVVLAMEIRSLVGLVLLYPLIRSEGGFSAMATQRPGLHIVRNIAHYSGQFGWVAALSMIPLAQLIAIEFTAPIWTALIAMAVLGERLTRRRITAILLGLVGVLIVVRPGLDYNAGQVIVLAAAVLFSIAFVCTKSLTVTESPVRIIFWMLVIQSAFGFVPVLIYWETPAASTIPWLLAFAFGGSYAHYFMARAMVHADASVVMPMDFVRVPATALLGWLVYSEAVDAWTVAGAALILLGNTFNLTGRRRVVEETTPVP